MKKILSISGSTRDNSTNHHLINAIAALTSEKFVVTLYEGIILASYHVQSPV